MGVTPVRALFPTTTGGLAISSVTYMESYEGILRERSPIVQAHFDRLISTLEVIPFALPEAARCAQLRAELRRLRRPVRPRGLDLLIAATALEHDLTLVTRNTADYRDVPGLKLHPGA